MPQSRVFEVIDVQPKVDTDLVQVTTMNCGTAKRRPGEALWTPDGAQIIASVGIVNNGRAADDEIAHIDPDTGSIRETNASGAMPSFQP
ncbi:MAG: hypothetical protein WCF36_11580 [Candidatus Nanopelagicales bacterium]